MGTKTITVTEEAYESLEAHKRDDESFTEAILRITGSERDVMKGFGSWEGADLRGAVEGHRTEFDADLEERVDELS
ncbi:antitoxin VapB family protein [Halovivax limisalsi]|uniref:antitoxin VapB family protein n=1 Tax=Halovivax limisalsi TaxID=1453760 RepID=UPI001FFD603F|nr:antitoxin VapB family protein [Halovivax limisalsi]